MALSVQGMSRYKPTGLDEVLQNLFRVRMTGGLTPLRQHGRGLKTLSAAKRYATVSARAHTWQERGEGVAAMYTSHGRGIDRSCLEPQRGAVLPGAAVASAANSLK